jgi:AraC family transcriptional regulator of adaptative response / DNA-3-methyladenine glycosylase II
MANAVVEDPNFFDPSISVEETIRKLRVIPGIREWTEQYIALRAFREMLSTTDVAVLRGAPSSREFGECK